MIKHLRNIAEPTKYRDKADYLDEIPFPAHDGFEWVDGEPGEGSTQWEQIDPVKALSDLVTQGQQAMINNPLPLDIQEQIFDLEPLVANCIRRNAYQIAKNKINAFTIAEDRNDVTAEQRTLVESLKSQMLALIP
jgi:hypothetical protein